MYQLLFFFIGPSNLGKSELKRIIQALYGPKMWHQPDLNVWGRPFAAGALISQFSHLNKIVD